MELLIAAVAVATGIVALVWPRRETPEGFGEDWISRRMSTLDSEVEGCTVRATVVYGERPYCRLEIDVRSLLDPRWRFSANLRTGKVTVPAEQRSLVLLAGSTPAIRDDQMVVIEEGSASFEMPFRDMRDIHGAVLDVLAIVRRTAAAASADSLSQAFHSATEISEIERYLSLSIALHPDHPATRRAIELASRSGEPVLQLVAARRFGGARKKALLLELVKGKHVPDGVRAEALELLEPFLDSELAQSIALPILAGSPSLSRRVALRLLARFPPREAPERLLEIAKYVQDLGTASDLVTTLSSIGGDRAVRGLEHLLVFPDVQEETLAALARLGDRRTVGAIREHFDLLEQRGLRDAANHAIEKIQERLGAPDGGRLSLVEPSVAGELSVIEPVGELGLADD